MHHHCPHIIADLIIFLDNMRNDYGGMQLSFVDLVGCERVKKPGSTGCQLEETQSINKSLYICIR